MTLMKTWSESLAINSIKLEAEIDAIHSLQHSEQNANAVRYGIAPLIGDARGIGTGISR